MLSFCLSQDWTWADCASRLLFFPWPSPYLQPPLGNARHLSFPLRCEFQIQVVPLLGLVSFIVFSVTVEILSLERGGVLQWGAYDRAQGRRQRTGWLLANLDHWALLPSSLAAKCGHMIEFLVVAGEQKVGPFCITCFREYHLPSLFLRPAVRGEELS